MAVDVELQELDYAGAMKFRFARVTDDDYTSGTPFVPNDLNLNRFQFVAINAVDSTADTANYEEDNDVVTATSGGTEVADNTTVVYNVMAVGR